VLDEATAHLDAVTEKSVLRALHQLMCGRTTLIIAHRAIEVKPAGQVLTLNDGRI
jgi:ABC-type multidrug transport system fused ATPase/permease subunit